MYNINTTYILINAVNVICRSYGVLVWEVATYGEVPHEHFHLHDIVEMANNKTLVLNRYLIIL